MPPPVHGVSAFNTALLARFDALGIPHRAFRIGTRGSLEHIDTFQTSKLVGDAIRLAEVGICGVLARSRNPVIYYTPSQGGIAAFRDAALTCIARAAGLPTVAHLHGCGWLDRWRPGGPVGRAMRTALEQTDRVVCLGETYARQMTAELGIPVIGLNNGVPPPPSPTLGAVPRASSRVELLYLSNLMKTKGVFAAADATRRLRTRLDVRLRCAGAWAVDAEREEFLRRFEPELASGTLELVGFADSTMKEQLLAEAHFFVLPTAYPPEGQPLSLIEAMARGVVPITTQQGAISDLFGFPGWERLATPRHREADGIAATIHELTEAPAEYQALSAACVQRYEDALTWNRCTDRLIEILASTEHADATT